MKNNIITVTAHIHPDGDVFIKGKDKKFHYVGFLIDFDDTDDAVIASVPCNTYLKAKKISSQK